MLVECNVQIIIFIKSSLAQVEEVLRETIYFVPADTRMEDGKPVGSSSKCASCLTATLLWFHTPFCAPIVGGSLLSCPSRHFSHGVDAAK